jgi:hypothetical protein
MLEGMPSTLVENAALASPLVLLSASEARVLGVRPSSQGYHRVRPGVHVSAQKWMALKPWERYAVRVHAYLQSHPDAVLCLESAAVVLGVPYFHEPRDIHVYSPTGRTSRRFGDVVFHTSSDEREVIEVGGIRTTSLLDTVVDLARVLPPAQGLAAADAAISPRQGGTLLPVELVERHRRQQNRRGRVRATWVFDRADSAAESPAESVSRAVIEWCGFETPELQREFRYEGFTDRADFFFPSIGSIGESDGWGKYHLDDEEEAARRLVAEKRREDRLRRNGHGFARWELKDAQAVKPLRNALLAAGVPLVRAPQYAMLTLVDERSRVMPRPTPRLRRAE